MPSILQNKQWLVQKYGGTSLGKLLPTITGTIIPQYLETHHVAVVCSAISGTEKASGTTSLLIKAIEYSMSSTRSEIELNRMVDTIRDQHLDASKVVRGEVEDSARSNGFQILDEGIVEDCEQLRSFLFAARTIGECSERSKDRVLATGEKLACRVVVASLMSRGIKAKLVTLDDIVARAYTDDKYKQQVAYDELGPRFFDGLAIEIGRRLEECGETVPVVTGKRNHQMNSINANGI